MRADAGVTEAADSHERPVGVPSRRGFFAWATFAAGMAVSYGTAAFFAIRYLTPNRKPRTLKAYAGGVKDIPDGGSKTYTAPDGRKVVITNTGKGGFVALSDVCPHLGCKVHWEEGNKRFVCPCHDGVFDLACADVLAATHDEMPAIGFEG